MSPKSPLLQKRPFNPVFAGLAAALLIGVGVFVVLATRASEGSQYFIDKDSLGGQCSDARTPAQVTISTPWCSITPALAQLPGDVAGTVIFRKASTPYPDITISGNMRYLPLTLQPHQGEEAQTSLSQVNIIKNSTSIVIANFGKIAGIGIGEEKAKTTDPDNVVNITIRNNKQLPLGITLQDGVSNVTIENNQIELDDLAQTVSRTGVFFSSGSCTTAADGTKTCEQSISHVKIVGNIITGGVVGVNARKFSNLTIENNDISGQRRALVGTTCVHTDSVRTFAGGENLIVRDNYIHDMDAQGFFIKDGPVSGLTLENNVITSAIILNRTCSDPTASGFREVNIYEVSNAKIMNNTVAGQFRFSGGATGVNLSNNIMTALEVAGTAFSSRGHNLLGAISGVSLAPGDVIGSPTYDAVNKHHLAAGSLGIDAGTSEAAPATDKDGNGRIDIPAITNTGSGTQPYFDVGAYEHGSSTTTPPPAPTPTPTPTPLPPQPPTPPFRSLPLPHLPAALLSPVR